MRAYLSIGSNIDRERNIRSALAALRARWPGIVFSPVYESEAVGFEGAAFYNLAAGFDAEAPLEQVLATLHGIESAHGRERSGPKFSARTLDLDLLSWGEAVVDGDPATLPRREILKFDFVLRPLADIAPAQRHPTQGRTYGELWAAFTGPSSIRRAVSLAEPEAHS